MLWGRAHSGMNGELFDSNDGKQVPAALWWEGSLISAARGKLLCGVKVAFHPLSLFSVMHGENRGRGRLVKEEVGIVPNVRNVPN